MTRAAAQNLRASIAHCFTVARASVPGAMECASVAKVAPSAKRAYVPIMLL